MSHPAWSYNDAPARVYWELTRACDLACRHCRAEALPTRAPDELDTHEIERVLGELATATPPPHIVFTGGDPLKRPDLFRLIRFADALGLPVALAPSATMALDGEMARALQKAGVRAISLSVDGPAAAQHDAVRGVLGCFGWTLAAAAHVRAAGIPLQVNTLVTAATVHQLEDIAALVTRMGAARWSLFFLIGVGRGRALGEVEPIEAERTLRWVAASASRWPFVVSTTEAPHYRRIVLQQLRAAGVPAAEVATHPIRRAFGLRDGNGIMFIAANGDVTPSGFIPVAAGNVRDRGPLELYRSAPMFRALRDSAQLHGRCGACEFGAVCGGSRARAWARGDLFGEDPLCTWIPRALEAPV